MLWKRILAAVTVILVIAAIIMAKKKAKQMPIEKASHEMNK